MTNYIKISIAIVILAIGYFFWQKSSTTNEVIRVGILHSLTGTMAISEKNVANATLFAIEQINNNGGLLGKKIVPVLVDGKSNNETFKKEAKRLIQQENIKTIFGCWTSACRKSVKPIFEKYDATLFYPVQYEGLEQSENIIYTGAIPNQQILPALNWSVKNKGKKIFLVGSDYIFPHVANEIIKSYAKTLGATIVHEEYLMLGSTNMTNIIQKIKETKPDIILNSINGDSNIAFFNALNKAKIHSNDVPVMSFSVSQDIMKKTNAIGHYLSQSYFQDINTKENIEFTTNFKAKYGENTTISDPMEAAYISVNLWAQAVREASTFKESSVRSFIIGQSFNAPEGTVYLDDINHHLWKTSRITRFNEDNQCKIIWQSKHHIQPNPHVKIKSNKEWKNFINSLYIKWGNKWENITRENNVHI